MNKITLDDKRKMYEPHFAGVNFGTRDFVELIYKGLQKVVCGWWNGHTLQCIMQEMGFITMDAHGGTQNITQKGQMELWELYILHRELSKVEKERTL